MRNVIKLTHHADRFNLILQQVHFEIKFLADFSWTFSPLRFDIWVDANQAFTTLNKHPFFFSKALLFRAYIGSKCCSDSIMPEVKDFSSKTYCILLKDAVEI